MGFFDQMLSIFSDVSNSALPRQTQIGNGSLDLSKIKFVKSPNQENRRGEVRGIVLHHTGPFSNTQSIVNWLTNPQAKASANYVIGPAGDIVCLVKPEMVSWNVGISDWEFHGVKYHNINQQVIGIELCNFGMMTKNDQGEICYNDGRNVKTYNGKAIEGSITFPDGRILKGYYAPYPEAQIDSCIALCKALIVKYPQITSKDIITHYMASPTRKNDPFGLNVNNVINKIFE